AWASAVLAYLLFCPHVSWTEEMHLILILALRSGAEASRMRTSRIMIGVVLVMLYLLPGIEHLAGVRLPAVVLVMAFVEGLFLTQWVFRAQQAIFHRDPTAGTAIGSTPPS